MAFDLLENALPQLPDGPPKLSALALQSRVCSDLGRAAAGGRRAPPRARVPSPSGCTPRATTTSTSARARRRYLRAVECFSIENSRAKIDAWFERARALAPHHPEVIAGDAERAFVAVVHAVRRAKGDPNVDGKPGWLAADDPRLAPIRAQIDAALRGDPRCYRALVLRGRISEANGGVLSAVRPYEDAIAADPSRVEARVLLATLYVASSLPDLAEACVQKALHDGLDDPALHYLLANIYAVQGRRDDARRYLEAYVENRPGNRAAEVLLANLLSAEALSRSDRIEPAELQRYADRIRGLNPEDPKGLLVQAAALCKRRPRRYVEAIVLLEKAQAKMPGDRDVARQLAAAHRDLGWSLVMQKKRELAMDHFKTFLALAPAEMRTEAAHNALVAHCKGLERDGREQLRAGEAGRAEAAFQRSTELVPSRAEAFYQLGVARFHQQKLAPACAAFERAVALRREKAADFSDYVVPLIDALQRSGRGDDARRLGAEVLARPAAAEAATLAKIRAMLK